MKKLYLFLLLLNAGFFSAQSQTHVPDNNGILYVNATAAGDGAGDSWTDAIHELSDALLSARIINNNSSALKYSVKQIWVARGTYKPLYNASDAEQNKDGGSSNAFVLIKDVKVYGGFSGTESSVSDRDIRKIAADNETVLSGDLGVQNDSTDNAFHVIITAGNIGQAALDGFTISGGNARNNHSSLQVNGEKIVDSTGGGIYNLYSSLKLDNCSFINNSAVKGGSMYNYDCTVNGTNCIFSGNTAGDGGGVYNENGAVLDFLHCTFSANQAQHGGGGIYSNNGSAGNLSYCMFTGNRATDGGAIYNNKSGSQSTLINCSFTGNEVQHWGGAIYNKQTDGSLTNCIFSGNKASYGGGINNDSSSPVFINCTITGNVATGGGGGISSYGSHPSVINTIIWGNNSSVNDDGGSVSQIKYSIIEGKAVFPGQGNLNTDPLFVNPKVLSENSSDSGDYRLKTGSPAFDAGTTNTGMAFLATDLDGNPRITGAHPDLGAYEIQLAYPGDNGILYVNQLVKGGDQSGNSWANAIPKLYPAFRYGKALNDAKPGTVREIWVAGGTYQPGYSADDNDKYKDAGRDNAFVLIKDVQLLGGFSGIETMLSERDTSKLFTVNQTILSGALGTAKNKDSAAYHVIISSGNVGSAGLDGFIVSDGNADNSSSITVNGNKLTSDGGGGMYNISSSPSIANCLFRENSTMHNGGGMYNLNSSPVISRSIFLNNHAQKGGGMLNQNSSPVITNASFSSNVSDNINGSGDTYGGAIANIISFPVITNTVFSGNQAKQGQGGGAIYNESGTPVITNSLFSGNSSSSDGGAIYNNYNASVVIINCTLAGNSSGSNSGAIYYGDFSPSSLIANSIIWGNQGDGGDGAAIEINNGSLTASYSIIQSNTVIAGTNNSNENPKFVSPQLATDAPTTAGNYRLRVSSTAINNGDIDTSKYHLPPVDLDGNPRFADGKIGIGAYAAAYIFPDTLIATYDKKDTIILSWHVHKPTYSYISRDNFVIERSTDSTFMTNTEVVNAIPYNKDTTDYVMADNLMNMSGGSHIYYRLSRSKPGAISMSNVFRYTDLQIDMNTTQQADTVKAGATGSQVIITWVPFRGVWTSGTKFTINKTDPTAGKPETISLDESQARSGKYIDDFITYCHEFTYSIVVSLGNGFDSPPEITVPGKISVATMGSIYNLTASKGYFPERTELKWNSQGSFDNFIVKRAEYNSDHYVQLTTVAGSSANTFQTDDSKGTPGVYYKYMIVGMVNCNNTVSYSKDTLYAIGFRSPTGNIYGRIAYNNGQAVTDAAVRLEEQGAVQSGKSIYLAGNSESYLRIDSLNTQFEDSLFTVEAWIKPDNAAPESQVIFSRNGQYELGFNGDGKLYFSYNGQTVTAPYVNKNGSYIHVTGIHGQDSLFILLNELIIARKYDPFTTSKNIDKVVYIGRNQKGNYFKGFIDEMSVWNIALSDSLIARDYTRILAGNESGLAAYWRFDETIAGQFYDISHQSDEYNQNDGIIMGASHTDTIPGYSQLALKAYTDTSGNYMISGIPYMGNNGTTYKIAPLLGTHQFDPVSVVRLVSASSASFTVDFKDKSAFDVSGYVYYRNSSVPVKGVQFKIDGLYAQRSNGQLIETNSDGKFTISVPVGTHEVQAVNSNHVFANNGKITDSNGDLNYQKPISELILRDSTTVRFIGRVAGGAVQQAWPLGVFAFQK